MNDLQRLIQLAKADGGKFFVINEKGEPSLVIMSIEEYENVLLHKVKNQVEDIEDINRKIAEAQKEDLVAQARRNVQEELRSEVIDSTFQFDPMPDPANQNQSEIRAQWEDI